MSVDVLLGMQWGDEGKGKVVDFIAPRYQVVGRFQGGPNAGHTLVIEGRKFVLHQIPSGIFHEDIVNIIGNGVVLDAITLQAEASKLEAAGLRPQRNLHVSLKTALIIPTHRYLDAASESRKGDQKIGSTLKGIGPAYQDKYARQSLRVGDLLLPDFRQKYQALKERHLITLEHEGYEIKDLAEQEEKFFAALDYMRQFDLSETEYLVNEALAEGKTVLAEGAQGTLLDVDFGSYPYVTSSNTIAAGACTGLGVAPRHIGKVYGIFKAYSTRVGSGPFPTELFDETGEQIRREGHEFGSTTGRPRRTGWLDLPNLKYACMINGTTELLMMKADVLNSFEEIKVCTHYRLADGSLTTRVPHDLQRVPVEPVYQTLPGWGTSLAEATSFDTLPQALRNYVTWLEGELGLPISLISVGPDRAETILRS